MYCTAHKTNATWSIGLNGLLRRVKPLMERRISFRFSFFSCFPFQIWSSISILDGRTQIVQAIPAIRMSYYQTLILIRLKKQFYSSIGWEHFVCLIPLVHFSIYCKRSGRFQFEMVVDLAREIKRNAWVRFQWKKRYKKP